MLSIDPIVRDLPAGSRTRHAPALCLLLLAGLAACDLLGPSDPLPFDAVALVAPPEFQGWWARTEACSGLRGRLESIAWFVVPNVSVFATPAGELAGLWSRGSDGTRVVIAGGYLGSELVVRHEMLHALLDRGDHPSEYFVDRCHLTWASWGG